jgi:hypothetical protein
MAAEWAQAFHRARKVGDIGFTPQDCHEQFLLWVKETQC